MVQFSEDVRRHVREFLQKMESPVTLMFFGRQSDDPDECRYCEDTEQIAREIDALSDRVSVEAYDVDRDAAVAERFEVDKVPTLVLVDPHGRDSGIRYYGIPAGYEFTTLIEALVDVSRGKTELSDRTRASLQSLREPVTLKVFVTPT